MFLSFLPPQLCQAKGFVCEFCGNDKDIIFPFQLNKCQRCEGEPSLLVAGLGGSRAPTPRTPFIPLTWRDWKISNPRRLAKALSRDRREGEGGEEGLDTELYRGEKRGEREKREKTREVSRDMVEERQEGVKLVNVFYGGKGDEEEQEMTGGTSETEEEGEEIGIKQEEVSSKEKVKAQEGRDGQVRKEKVNFLKVLHLDRLKKRISKGDSESETCSSTESLDEVGQETKGQWKLSGLFSRPKVFSKRETECEEKTEIKVEESENRLLEKQAGTEEKAKSKRETDEGNEKQNKGEIKGAGTEKQEKFTIMKLLKPHQLSAVFFRGKIREEDKSEGGDEKREVETEEDQKLSTITQTNWRGRKTRKARRVSRGRKVREGAEEESRAEGGEGAELNDTDECTERGAGQE